MPTPSFPSAPVSEQRAGTWIAEHDPLPTVLWPVDDGFDPHGRYVETYWLPVLGPASVVAFRRLNARLDARPSGLAFDLGDLAHSLGLGRSTARNSPIVRTLHRLEQFGLARVDHGTYAVRRTAPALTRRQADRLPAHLIGEHRRDLVAIGRARLAQAV